MERKFTPGPWSACLFRGVYPGIDADEAQLSVVHMGEDSGIRGATKEECEANAHLIAASPDLFEVVHRYVAANIGGKHLLEAANAALSKATGTQPNREGE